jgi:hypothetical protein
MGTLGLGPYSNDEILPWSSAGIGTSTLSVPMPAICLWPGSSTPLQTPLDSPNVPREHMLVVPKSSRRRR